MQRPSAATSLSKITVFVPTAPADGSSPAGLPGAIEASAFPTASQLANESAPWPHYSMQGGSISCSGTEYVQFVNLSSVSSLIDGNGGDGASFIHPPLKAQMNNGYSQPVSVTSSGDAYTFSGEFLPGVRSVMGIDGIAVYKRLTADGWEWHDDGAPCFEAMQGLNGFVPASGATFAMDSGEQFHFNVTLASAERSSGLALAVCYTKGGKPFGPGFVMNRYWFQNSGPSPSISLSSIARNSITNNDVNISWSSSNMAGVDHIHVWIDDSPSVVGNIACVTDVSPGVNSAILSACGLLNSYTPYFVKVVAMDGSSNPMGSPVIQEMLRYQNNYGTRDLLLAPNNSRNLTTNVSNYGPLTLSGPYSCSILSSVGVAPSVTGDCTNFNAANSYKGVVQITKNVNGVNLVETVGFNWVPQISNVALSGSVVTITGSNFSVVGTPPTIQIDGQSCTSVTMGSSSSLTCTAPGGLVGGTHTVTYTVNGLSAIGSGTSYSM